MGKQYSESAADALDSDRGAAGEFHEHALQLPVEAAGMRLDQALARALPQYSRARLQGWIEAGAVAVDGRRLRAKDRVLGGEQVRVRAHCAVATRIEPEPRALNIVYQDRALLVIDKPAGWVVHPGAGNPHHTLQNALLAFDPALARVPRAGLVHRLDKDTSGLLVVARSLEAHLRLVEALADRQIERSYLAVCTGVLTGGGTVAEPIGRHRTQRTRMTVRADGRAAVTHYRIVERFRAHTLVQVRLETGRTHQIRVHLAHIGHPLVGDPVYGGRRRLPAGCSAPLAAALQTFRRQALHASRLALSHPLTGRPLVCESPMPADLAALCAALAVDVRAQR
ncbi:MAG: 23S rRNA pseudouridine(1911/1915/1917) synthase RluD [Pseudomonadota bacterium]|jgi:23S rRNA pseudouridine1911/1915/1917 synthase|nr:23S rRNA pseudouridine(1911/1915/1917) synthase RluD [Pseudomonadota bacterium]